MGTTTIRVDTDTHARLLALSQATGASLIETVRDAAEALRRQRFAHQVAAELAELREDPSGVAGLPRRSGSHVGVRWHQLTISGSSILAIPIPVSRRRTVPH